MLCIFNNKLNGLVLMFINSDASVIKITSNSYYTTCVPLLLFCSTFYSNIYFSNSKVNKNNN